MRISGVAPVVSSTSAPVDRVDWHEQSRRVRPVEACATERVRHFQEIMEKLSEQPHRRRIRVIEVVSAQGIRPGNVRIDHGQHDSNQ